MKKILIFLFVLGMVLPTKVVLAQNKKVAILETVDKEGNISYAYKLMLRSNLAKAITKTPGYEAYDRTDMDAIMGEHNFQRTGMVSDDQIKLLGEMTGAAYILVAEAVKVDNENMFITAKILNVETARTEMSDNVLMGTDAVQIQDGCIELASKLFGVSLNAAYNSVSRSNTLSDSEKSEYANKVFGSNSTASAKEAEPIREKRGFMGKFLRHTEDAIVVPNHHEKKNSKNNNGLDFKISRAMFYGVDYTQVSVFGAKESPEEFIETFPIINRLLVEEYKKYVATLEKSLDVEIVDVDLKPVIEMCKSINPQQLFTYRARKEGPDAVPDANVAEVLSVIDIPQRNGFGLMLFAVELNKDRNVGYYQMVIFDNQTKNVLVNKQIKGEAGGLGLRNFWANSLYEAFKKASLE